MPGYFEHDCREGHRLFLESIDARARRLGGTVEDGERPQTRLAASQVLLVAGGDAGARAARAMAGIGLGHLSVVALTERDRLVLAAAIDDHDMRKANLLPGTFDIYGAAMQLRLHQLLAFASSRPYPRVQTRLNDAAVRIGMPFAQVSMFAHEIVLGPTVIPGHTACNACLDARLASNAGRTDVIEARDRFLDKNPDFQFEGRLAAIDAAAAALLVTEVTRMLSGSGTPVALSTEVTVSALTQARQEHFVPYMEWCVTCRSRRVHAAGLGFGEFTSQIREIASAEAIIADDVVGEQR